MSLRILITNNTLDQRAGSEVYVRDIALALQRQRDVAHIDFRAGALVERIICDQNTQTHKRSRLHSSSARAMGSMDSAQRITRL